MTLVDAGPLIALIDADDARHEDCRHALINLPDSELITTWACLAEAMHFLGKIGIASQLQLWDWVESGVVVLDDPPASDWRRTRDLMKKYADLPMDVADATLVALADRRKLRRIFTIDRDFYIYRRDDGASFEIHP